MLEVAATTPSNPLVGGRVVDISLLTNDAAGPNSAAGRPRIAAGTPLTRAARHSTVTLFYTPIERAIPKRCFAFLSLRSKPQESKIAAAILSAVDKRLATQVARACSDWM